MKTASQLHWDYFLLLEKDLIALSDYIELSEENFNAYGPRLAQFVLSVGSELDVVLKFFLQIRSTDFARYGKQNLNMGHYRKALQKIAKSQFETACVKLARADLALTPWAHTLGDLDVPISWWRNYNNVKHERSKYYVDANLETALMLFSALFIVNAYINESVEEDYPTFSETTDWGSHEHFDDFEEILRKKSITPGTLVLAPGMVKYY